MSGPSAVRDATLAARDFGTTAGLGPADGARLAIIVEELIANLYDHGGLGDGEKVHLSLSTDPGGIRLMIEATGASFHPGLPRAGTSVPERGGGAGLRLVQAWSLTIDHEHEDGRNRWTVVVPVERDV